MALSPELVHRRLRAAVAELPLVARGPLPRLRGGGVAVFPDPVPVLRHALPRRRVRALGRVPVRGRAAGGRGGAGAARRGCARCRNWPSRGASRSRARRSGNALVNAVQFDRELRPGSAMRAAVFEELADPFPRVNWARGVRPAAAGASRRRRWAWRRRWFSCGRWLRPAAFANSVARVFLPASRHRAADPHAARNAHARQRQRDARQRAGRVRVFRRRDSAHGLGALPRGGRLVAGGN